jgi:hypothetical protein
MPPKPKQSEKFAWETNAIEFSDLPESLQKYAKQAPRPADDTEADNEPPPKDEEVQ